MASNKDAAAEAMVIAEEKLMEKDIRGAKTHASMAQNFYPELDGLSQLIKVIDVHIAYAKTVCGEVDWYGVLSVDPAFDDDLIRKQFLKLSRILHPDKNKASYAEGAFKILTQAWGILSDKARRETYDQRLERLKAATTGMNGVHVYARDSSSTRYANSSSHPSSSESFWTKCRLCRTYLEYRIGHRNQLILCLKCKAPFFAVSQPAPPENGRKSFKPVSIFQHLNDYHSYPSSGSVPLNVRGNCLPTAKTGTYSLSSHCSTDTKKFHLGLTKNPSGPANSSLWPSSGSRMRGVRSTSGPVTSFHSASDGNHHFSRMFSPLPNSKTGETSSPSIASTEHVKIPPHGTLRLGGPGSAFSTFSGSYSTSKDIQPSSILTPGGAETSSGPGVSSSLPASGTTAFTSARSNDGEKTHASLFIQRESSGSATSLFQSKYPPQVLFDVKHDISKTKDKESCISTGELMKKRQADEYVLLSKGRLGIANKKASGSRNSPQVNRFTNMNNNLGANRISVHGSSKSKNAGNLSQPQLRSALLQKAKSDLHKKLNEWSMTSPSLPMPKIDVKKRDSRDTAETSDATSAKSAKKVDGVIQNVQGSHQAQTSSVATACETMDTNTKDYVTMDVPDPDFHDFDQQRVEEMFSQGQVWALYDDDDGMPRFYALVNSVKSVRPFKIEISRLNPKTNTKTGPMDWKTSGFTKTIGDFRIGKHVMSNALSAFSHIVKSNRLPKGIIQIYPGKGETWALYRNWSSSWNENVQEEEIHQYDIVLVLDDYNEQQGVLVAPLAKVAGFRSVFRQDDEYTRIQAIQKEELFRFSHRVPSYTLTGEEAQNAPKGYMELDPAAMPMELLKVIHEDNVVQEDGNSDSNAKPEDEYYRNRLDRVVFTYSSRKRNRHTLHLENQGEGQRR
ncbi:hypothetical protein Leryth_006507 [Lithospermum erythrorhizon]|nr:hypothetical protein Leryth_006507 [Lithospermum erythrorhizon]